MSKTKIAVSLDERLVSQIDEMVSQSRFTSRSQAIEAAVAEAVKRARRQWFAEQCAKLDPEEEVALAEEGLAEDFAEWPPY